MGRDGQWWIGWIEEVPGVNCQEASREELLDSLTVTLREMLEIDPAKSPVENFERELITI
ncbi:MAG: type II toxin-antitoxin system HicB family antitoxin [Nitrospinae bacterium]|nr:type II toxin-antitoxin system HicB family antitoxin [Nitrospinota bacterium]